MLDRKEEILSENLINFRVTAISRTEIKIKITFAEPILVS